MGPDSDLLLKFSRENCAQGPRAPVQESRQAAYGTRDDGAAATCAGENRLRAMTSPDSPATGPGASLESPPRSQLGERLEPSLASCTAVRRSSMPSHTSLSAPR